MKIDIIPREQLVDVNIDEFHREIFRFGPWNGEAFRCFWEGAYDQNRGFILAAYDEEGERTGMLGFIAWVEPMSGREVISEAFWVVHKQYRETGVAERLLEALEGYAKERNVPLVMPAPANRPWLQDVYDRRGYIEMETLYCKGGGVEKWQQQF
jgi:GNAT superfamily N-acetyltransferase